jgi:type II secretory pathway component PulF
MSAAEAQLYGMLFSNSQRMALYEKIAAFLEDGIDLHTVVQKLGMKYLENGETDPRAKILLEWAEAMNNGRSFSSAVGSWVPSSEAMLIKAGEQSGDLGAAMRNAVYATMSVKEMKSKLTGELGYPVALILALFGMMYMIATNVMPELAAASSPDTWPGGAQTLHSLTEYVRTKGHFTLAGVVLFCMLISYTFPRLAGPVRDILDKIPPYSTYRSVQSSIFLISLSSQMKSGVPVVESIQSMQGMSNRYVSYHLGKMLKRLNSGVVVGKSLNAGFMDVETGVDIELFGETSNLQDAMESIGRRSIDNTLESIGAMAGTFRGIAIVALGIFIGWTFTSIQAITQTMAAAAGV